MVKGKNRYGVAIRLAATIKFDEEGESLGYSDGSLVSAKFRAKRNKKGEKGCTKGILPFYVYKPAERSLILAGDYDLNERNAFLNNQRAAVGTFFLLQFILKIIFSRMELSVKSFGD